MFFGTSALMYGAFYGGQKSANLHNLLYLPLDIVNNFHLFEFCLCKEF